jgi:hypothetical protein
MSDIKIIDNFLDKKLFEEIQNILLSSEFAWYYNKDMNFEGDNKIYFTHKIYESPIYFSNKFYLFKNVLNKINPKSLLRIKGNLYVKEKQKTKHNDHVDYTFKHKGCLFYINNNNGETYFGKEKVLPKENRMVFFDPSKKHSSSSCDDSNIRITINFNYL